MKKKILSVILIVFALGTLVGCGEKKEVKKVKTKENNIFVDQKVDVYTFKDAKIVDKDGKKRFTVTGTNTSSERQNIKEVRIHLKNSKGKELDNLIIYSAEWIDGNASINMWVEYNEDIKEKFEKASSLEYEIVK